jgi:hypothetical protein
MLLAQAEETAQKCDQLMMMIQQKRGSSNSKPSAESKSGLPRGAGEL